LRVALHYLAVFSAVDLLDVRLKNLLVDKLKRLGLRLKKLDSVLSASPRALAPRLLRRVLKGASLVLAMRCLLSLGHIKIA
jgi:hypothetical protein